MKQLDLLNNAGVAWREYTMNLCESQSGRVLRWIRSSLDSDADRQFVQQPADAVFLKTLAR
jgi:hypothetical protein